MRLKYWLSLLFLIPHSQVQAEVYFLPGDSFFVSQIDISERRADGQKPLYSYDTPNKTVLLGYSNAHKPKEIGMGEIGFDRLIILDAEATNISIEDICDKERQRYLKDVPQKQLPMLVFNKDYSIQKFGIGN